MFPSRYLLVVPLAGRPDTALLFSTRTGALAAVSREAAGQLAAGAAPAGLGDELAGLGLLVPDREAEQRELFAFLDAVNRDDRQQRLSVILGMACNFACPYCYEGSDKGAAAMDRATAGRLVDFAAARLGEETERLSLKFYGGETLLYLERLKEICAALQPLCAARGAAFDHTLVTNGSLLTPAVVEELLPLGLAGAKVTIDGPPETHNRSRPFKGGSPSFATVVANLAAVAHRVPLAVAGNFGRANHHLFPALFDHLAAAGLGPKQLKALDFHPAMQVAEAGGRAEFTGGCATANESWVIEATLALREAALARGYAPAEPGPSPCMVDVDGALVVHHDGTLYKCPAMIGRPELSCGDIRRGLDPGFRQTLAVDHWRFEAKCRDCLYLPLCFGGCRFMAVQRDGHLRNVDCQFSFYEATLPTILNQDFTYRYAAE